MKRIYFAFNSIKCGRTSGQRWTQQTKKKCWKKALPCSLNASLLISSHQFSLVVFVVVVKLWETINLCVFCIFTWSIYHRQSIGLNSMREKKGGTGISLTQKLYLQSILIRISKYTAHCSILNEIVLCWTYSLPFRNVCALIVIQYSHFELCAR